ncbi:MarR family winged helix-turn-helix transcriptional regulator [Acrocarpospora phusangensis]|uniref:MarR family winged helix-turn-helix transcriptional regulator n=1 Tax=Acrocarpospora phusangensis TaxID=1070424 RepID=UPI00194FC203|nr:MarR family transcriptional regulator [Acrocarpospora phusangensis]
MAEQSEGEDLALSLTHELFDLGTAIDLIGNAAATRLGINQTDLICLNLLVRYGPMSPGQIAATLGVTTAAISAMASRLESGGYAHREIDPADRRRVLLHASPTGASQAFNLFDHFYAATAALQESSTESELRALLTLLTRFREVIQEQAAAIRSDDT